MTRPISRNVQDEQIIGRLAFSGATAHGYRKKYNIQRFDDISVQHLTLTDADKSLMKRMIIVGR